MMPIPQRLSYGFGFALALLIGHVIGFVAFLSIANLLDPSADQAKFSTGEWVAIIAALGLLFGSINSVGGLLGGLLVPIVCSTYRLWFIAGLAGAVNAVLLLTLTYTTYFKLLSPAAYLITVCGGVLSAVLVRQAGLSTGWARHWYPPGACQACGYDLRQTPAGTSCPECGEPVPDA